MKPVFLITDGGPHSAHKWAMATAQFIADLVQIDDGATSPDALAGRKARALFQFDLTEMLEDCHATVQDGERTAIAEAGSGERGYDTEQYLDAAVSCVHKAAHGTPFELHFSAPVTESAVRAILSSHFATSMHCERSWHQARAAQG
jgi:hypothetical protein